MKVKDHKVTRPLKEYKESIYIGTTDFEIKLSSNKINMETLQRIANKILEMKNDDFKKTETKRV